ncbi:hypothetical protein F0415_11700 [Arenimonas fontis]|uniref:DUF2007 domain-containing protein n=2 Tax=Arenimonas fontis TaxID=2608255 RepID=A0A5B2Z9Z7_9GAMM|nr:hypothetical protein F0415_11700 [Arenimonas fontis]
MGVAHLHHVAGPERQRDGVGAVLGRDHPRMDGLERGHGGVDFLLPLQERPPRIPAAARTPAAATPGFALPAPSGRWRDGLRSSANRDRVPEIREKCELHHSSWAGRPGPMGGEQAFGPPPRAGFGEVMVPVYIAQSALDAQLVRDLLTGAGIHAHVFGPNVAGAIPEVPGTGLIRVVVEEAEAEQAQALIRDWESAPDEAEVEAAALDAADGTADLRLPDDEAIELDLLADPDDLLSLDGTD